MVQNNAICFISNVKGRENIFNAPEALNLETLASRRYSIRHNLLHRLLGKVEYYAPFIDSDDELMKSNTKITRAATRDDPHTAYAKTSTTK